MAAFVGCKSYGIEKAEIPYKYAQVHCFPCVVVMCGLIMGGMVFVMGRVWSCNGEGMIL